MRKGTPHPKASDAPSVDAPTPRRGRSQANRLTRSSRRGSDLLNPAVNNDVSLSDFTSLFHFSSASICLISFTTPVSCDTNEWSFADALYATPSKCLQANPSFTRTFQKGNADEVIGQDLKTLFPETLGFREMFQTWHNHHLSRDGFEFQHISRAGKPTSLRVACYGHIVGNGLHRMWIITREATKGASGTRATTTTEHHLRAVLDQPGVLFLRAYPDGTVSFCTEETRRALGIDAHATCTVETILGPRCHPSDRQTFEGLTFQRHLQSPTATRVAFRLITQNRGVRPYSVQQIPARHGDEVAFYDIIAVETPVVVDNPPPFLASGFAHDANNHLLIAGANVQTAERILGQNHAALTPLRAALSAITQASTIYAQGRKLEFGITPVPAIVDIGQEFDEIITQCQPLLSDRITLSTSVRAGVIFVRIDRCHVRQILTNLILNAREALKDTGIITLSATRKGKAPGERCPIHGHEVACVSVSDNGPGIDLPILETIFTPFFSTKPSSTPRGLGLAMVKTLIERNKGELSVTTVQGIGTTFTLCLPSVTASDSDGASLAAPSPQPNRSLSILVADDEPYVRDIFEGALTARGHQTTICQDGSSLLATLKKAERPFDAIIVDDGMPGSSSPELIKSIRQILPEIPIIAVSGDPSVARRIEAGDTRTTFLGKPFTFEKLYAKVETDTETTESTAPIVPPRRKRAASLIE